MHFDPGPGLEPVPGDQPVELYVHIPFCESLCPFCTFHRVLYREDRAASYFQALHQEIERYRNRGFVFDDVYIGGGTPTVRPQELFRLLGRLNRDFDLKGLSVETNPNHLTPDRVRQLADAGVTRLSVGVQSFDDALLRQMGRYQPYGSAQQNIDRLSAVQGLIGTLNVDVIFNWPSQTRESLDRDLEVLVKVLEVDQASFYPLMPRGSRQETPGVGMAPGPNQQDFYQRIVEVMTPTHPPSTAWCFSRNAVGVDEYIVNRDEFVGVGSGSFSYVGGRLLGNTFSLRGYVKSISSGGSPVIQGRDLGLYERMQYDLVTRLFGLGWSKGDIRARYGAEFEKNLRREIWVLKTMGALSDTGPTFQVTQKGMYLWVVMMLEFLNGVNALRAEIRRESIRANIAQV